MRFLKWWGFLLLIMALVYSVTYLVVCASMVYGPIIFVLGVVVLTAAMGLFLTKMTRD